MIKKRSNYRQETLEQGFITRGSMRQVFYILSRAIQPGTPDNPLPSYNFGSPLFTIMGQTVPIRPEEVFDGIALEDTPSHYGYVTYDPAIEALGTNTCFVKVEYNSGNRYYKLIKQMNFYSQDRFLKLWLRESSLNDLIPASEQ